MFIWVISFRAVVFRRPGPFKEIIDRELSCRGSFPRFCSNLIQTYYKIIRSDVLREEVLCARWRYVRDN